MRGFDGTFAFPGGVGIRFTRPEDEPFLLQLFIEARPWLSWAEGERDFIHGLYEQQYKVMRAGQEARYPEHLDFVIDRLGTAVGRVVVDLGYVDWRISEIQISQKARWVGIGTHVIRGLQTAAQKACVPITLSTMMFGSQSRTLYQRMGFQLSSTEPPFHHMIWYPTPIAASAQRSS